MLNPDFFKTVSYNCDVSDANYWGYFSICTLLLRLRELFKIERGLEPWDSISNEEILPWIEKKEAVWKKLENATLVPIQINGNSYSPFDIDEINSIIVNNGFVYGAGFALFMKPSFFVGSIYRFEKIDGYNVYFIDKEIVRDIFSSPGMSVGDTIFIRLTDIKYRLWEDLQSWRGKNSHEFFLKYGILHDSQISSEEFKKIVNTYSKIVLYHEIAEQQLNSSCWNEMIKKCDNSKTEHILRGIIDFIADFSEKGPVYKAVLERNKELLSLYILTQGAYQKKILKPVFLQIQKALISDDWQKIEEIRNLEFNRWKNNHKQILEIFKLQGFEAVKNLTDKIFVEGGIN
ncbi:Sfum_1244 family protein [Thermodesulfovibrio sp. 3907-1M]|uniref:Sfum_1244 family protein n=1 Tax=Thermodesulfovibrio autotrophicus TaxID=3118333 RepID=A0AAU8H1C7_9BACT